MYRVHDIKRCIAVLIIYYSPSFFREETTAKITILRAIFHPGFPESAVPALQKETHGCHWISDSRVTLTGTAESCFQWPTPCFCQYTLWSTTLQTFEIAIYSMAIISQQYYLTWMTAGRTGIAVSCIRHQTWSDITRSAGQRLFKSCTRQSIVLTSVLLFSILNLQN